MDIHDLNAFFLASVRSIKPKEIGNRGFFPTNKNSSGIVEYESQIERDLFIILQHAKDVKRFQHQPLTISYVSKSGKKRKYTPDAMIEFDNNEVVVIEIKDIETYTNNFEKYRERWNACDKWCRSRGYRFEVLTEEEVRTPRFYNIWFTLGSSKDRSNDKYMNRLVSLLSEIGLEYNRFCETISDKFEVSINKASQIISYAIYHGIVYVDTFSLNVITGQSIIKRKSRFGSTIPPYFDEFHFLLSKNIPNNCELEDNSSFQLSEHQVLKLDETATKRESAVMDFLKTPSKNRTNQWRIDISKKYGVGISTIYSWVKKYNEKGKEGFKSKYTAPSTRWDEITISAMEDARNLYFKQHLSLIKLYEEFVKPQLKDKIEIPSYSSFWRYVRQNMSFYEEDIRQKGKSAK